MTGVVNKLMGLQFLSKWSHRLSIRAKILVPLLGSVWLMAGALVFVSLRISSRLLDPIGHGGSDAAWRIFELQTIGITLALVLVASVGLTLLAIALANTLIQPIQRLTDMAQQVSRGNLWHRAAITNGDELGLLALHLNEMADHLGESYQTLRGRAEELERRNRELHQKQNELLQTETLSAIAELVASIAHEINNPLTSVIGYAELLQALETDPRVKEYSKTIVVNAVRTHRIIEDLLIFAHERPLEKVPVNFEELIESALKLPHFQLRSDNIELLTELTPNLPRTMADPRQIQKVLLNLIDNARRAIVRARKGSRITVRLQANHTDLRISVSDDGPGIPPEIISKIFDPLFSTREVGEGPGLGLSTSYGIVRQHGGRIWAESTPGRGATFFIDLPITPPAQALDNAHSLITDAGRRKDEKSLLIIDDEAELADLVASVLTTDGWAVDTALDGRTAVVKLEDRVYDLVICDMTMPGLSGLQLYERLKLKRPSQAARIIFLTNDRPSSSTQRFLRNSGATWLEKPFNLPALRELASRLMDGGPPNARQLQPNKSIAA